MAVLAAGTAVLSAAWLTGLQVGYWRNGETLYRRSLQVIPEDWFAHYSLGTILREQGRSSEALRHLERSIELFPAFAQSRVNYAIALYEGGRPQEAVNQLRLAVELRPDLITARRNLGLLLLEAGRILEAEEQLNAARRLEASGSRFRELTDR
jgi:tetratricopeptide (TPR) repeat protein